jgi:hypothetical protein
MIDYTEELLRGRNHNTLGRSNGHTWAEHLAIADRAYSDGDDETCTRHLDEAAASYVATVQGLSRMSEDRFAHASEGKLLSAAGVAAGYVSTRFKAKVFGTMVSIVPNIAPLTDCDDTALMSATFLNLASQLPWGTGAAFIQANLAVGRVMVKVTPPASLDYHWRPMPPATEQDVVSKALAYFTELGSRMRGGELSLTADERERALSSHSAIKEIEESLSATDAPSLPATRSAAMA